MRRRRATPTTGPRALATGALLAVLLAPGSVAAAGDVEPAPTATANPTVRPNPAVQPDPAASSDPVVSSDPVGERIGDLAPVALLALAVGAAAGFELSRRGL